VKHDASLGERRDDRPSHGSSLASDPHGCGKCHYDVGNIIDHAIAAFVSPFTSDGMFEPSWMALDLTRSRCVEERMPWQACMLEFKLTCFCPKAFCNIGITSELGHWANVPSDAVNTSLWARAQHPCCLIQEIDSSHLVQHPPISIRVTT
jgi:hypothetical protein